MKCSVCGFDSEFFRSTGLPFELEERIHQEWSKRVRKQASEIAAMIDDNIKQSQILTEE